MFRNQPLAGDEPAATCGQKHIDTPEDIATSSQFAGPDAPTIVADPNQSHNPAAGKNAADVGPTDVIEPWMGHGTGSGEGRLTNAPKAPNIDVDSIQPRFALAKSSHVWDTYVKKAGEADKDLIDDWDRWVGSISLHPSSAAESDWNLVRVIDVTLGALPDACSPSAN